MHSFDYNPSDSFGNKYHFLLSSDKNALKKQFKDASSKYINPLLVVDINLLKSYTEIVKEICNLKILNILYLDPSKKDLERVKKIWTAMVKTVPDILISVGGGTIGDLTGFAAATYQRGISRVYFPTTILSMVDASIGGKTGFDFVDVKNVIGAVHYPLYVINYLPFLSSLSKKEYRSGFAEIIKAAVLYDKEFFNELESYIKKEDIFDFNNQRLQEIFISSSKLKAKICEVKNNKKNSLLYGHAVGHALEKVSALRIRHGEGVTIGMTIEGAIACQLGVWSMDEWKRQTNIIRLLKLPYLLPDEVDIKSLAHKMTYYKKLISKESYLFSIPKAFGVINNFDTSCMTKIRREEMIPTLTKIKSWIEENV